MKQHEFEVRKQIHVQCPQTPLPDNVRPIKSLSFSLLRTQELPVQHPDQRIDSLIDDQASVCPSQPHYAGARSY